MSNEKKYNILKGKLVLISGATYGIGEQVAVLMAKHGANLILTARTEAKLVELKTSLECYGVIVKVFIADLYDLEQTKALVEFIKNEKIDIFINNAGKSICRPIADSYQRMGDFTRTMSLNYYSPVMICLSLLSRGRLLKVVNVSTMNVLLPPTPYWAAYGASKSAFDYWLRSVASEFVKKLSVGTVYFSLVRTRMIEPTVAYRKVRALSVERAAEIVLMMVVGHKKRWMSWWGWFAIVGAWVFKGWYQRMAMKIIDDGKSV